MLAAQSTADAIPARRLYAKTELGRAEIAQRGAGLSARQRQVLIMLDGHKRVDALAALIPAAQLDTILGELVRLALIAPVDDAQPPAPPDLSHLAPVKAMMIRTATTYLGPMAAELIRQIDNAPDDVQLQRALGHWHMAMRASKYGKDVADTHLDTIRESLRNAGQLTATA